MKRLIPISVAIGLLSFASFAQNNGQNNGQNNPNQDQDGQEERGNDSRNNDARFWEAKMPTGNYMVALDRINSVAKHEYVISNAASRVVELTLTTSGSSVVRFYYVEPVGTNNAATNGVVQRGQDLVDRAGRRANLPLNNVVTKEYPVTTHTGQVEYRVSSEQAISQLHTSISRAWKDRRGRVVTVQ